MKTEQMIARVIGLEEAKKGVLLFHTDYGMLVFHGDTTSKTMYHYEAFCQDKYMKDRMIVLSDDTRCTKDVILDIMHDTFKDRFHDVTCGLNGILVVNSEKDFQRGLLHIETHDTSDTRFEGCVLKDEIAFSIDNQNIIVINTAILNTMESDEDYRKALTSALTEQVVHMVRNANHILTEEEKANIIAA